jgi:hypothetical protein
MWLAQGLEQRVPQPVRLYLLLPVKMIPVALVQVRFPVMALWLRQ